MCGRTHFEQAVREEARAEIHEQFEAKTQVLGVPGNVAASSHTRPDQELPAARAESRSEWKVMDRYCWLCGTHGAIFKSATRCSKCGELQRLYIRDVEAGAS